MNKFDKYDQIPQRELLAKLFSLLSQFCEPTRSGKEEFIIYRGLKMIRVLKAGELWYQLEDVSFDTYSPIRNRNLIAALIEHETERAKAITAKANCAKVAVG